MNLKQMDHILYSTFLDDRDVAERIYALVADCLLGPKQAEKIRLRYYDMYRNFFKYKIWLSNRSVGV